jgi:hypothetical protein
MPKPPFEYQRPNEEQVSAIEVVRSGCAYLLAILEAHVPAGRQRSLAITNLEQTSMWANKGIVFAEE